jgi:uncharacterized membrane protein
MALALQITPWKFVLWNLFLAAIPVALAYLMEAGIRRWTLGRRRVPWALWLPLAAVWLAFLPNTCYLLTEWRHFLFDGPMPDLIRRADTNRQIMLDIAEMGVFYLIYSGLGILSFALSIRPVQRVMRDARVSLLVPGIAFFLLTSLGVYLGLIVRLNSWDLWTRPRHVMHVIGQSLANAALLEVIIVFAALLWVLYEVTNLWVDGVALRLRWLGKERPVCMEPGDPL